MDSVPPPSQQKEDRPLTFVSAAIWTLLAVFLTLLILGITEAGREGALYDLVSRTGCQALAYSIVLFAILRVHEPETSIRHVLALRTPAITAIILALLVGAALSLPTEWLNQVLDVRYPRAAAEKEALDRLYSVATTGKRVALVLTVIVIQPALDELFFHGALFTPLRRTRRAETVIVATAALETLAYLSPRAMLFLLVATLVFAWIRGATGSIFPSMVARMAYFGVSVVPMVSGHEIPKPSKVLIFGCAVVGLLGLLGLSFLSRRDAKLLDARLEDGQ